MIEKFPSGERFTKGNIVVLGASIFISLIILEMGARWVYRPYVHPCMQFLQHSTNPDLVWEHKRRVRVQVKGLGFGRLYKISLDRYGFRRTEDNVKMEKSPGLFRVLLLGDSVAEGFGVDDEQIFSFLLEKGLPNTQILNAATAAYNTYQQVAYFRDEGKLFLPDVVVLVFCFNDVDMQHQIHESWHLGETVRFPEGYSPVFVKGRKPKERKEYSLKEWIYYNIYSYRLLSDSFHQVMLSLGIRKSEDDITRGFIGKCYDLVQVMEDPDSVQMKWFLDQVLQLQEMVKKINSRLIVLIFPFRCQVQHQLVKPALSIKQMLEAHQITTYDLMEIFKNDKDFIGSYHLSSRGHRKLADFLKEILIGLQSQDEQDLILRGP